MVMTMMVMMVMMMVMVIIYKLVKFLFVGLWVATNLTLKFPNWSSPDNPYWALHAEGRLRPSGDDGDDNDSGDDDDSQLKEILKLPLCSLFVNVNL